MLKEKLDENGKLIISKGGTPNLVITDEMRALVRRYSAAGVRVVDIAACIKNPNTGKSIGRRSLYEHFLDDMKEARAQRGYEISEKFKQDALNGDSAALKALAEKMLDYKELPDDAKDDDKTDAATTFRQILDSVMHLNDGDGNSDK